MCHFFWKVFSFFLHQGKKYFVLYLSKLREEILRRDIRNNLRAEIRMFIITLGQRFFIQYLLYALLFGSAINVYLKIFGAAEC